MLPWLGVLGHLGLRWTHIRTDASRRAGRYGPAFQMKSPSTKNAPSVPMNCSRRSSCWLGQPIWHNYGLQCVCDASITLPKNPFRRLSDDSETSDASYGESYHAYQLSCYTENPTRQDTDEITAPTAVSEGDTRPGQKCRNITPARLIISTLPVISKMGEAAKLSASRELDHIRAEIKTWWLSSRSLRRRLLRLATCLITLLLIAALLRCLTAETPHVYVLVHACQYRSVYRSQ